MRAAWNIASPEDRPKHFESLCGPSQAARSLGGALTLQTFENRAALVAAEIARIEGRMLDAQELYEKAIRSAHVHGFVHNEALANELAGLLLRGARLRENCDDLSAGRALLLPALGSGRKGSPTRAALPADSESDKPISDATATIHTPVEQLDLATVIKVSEAVSGEIVFEKLIDTHHAHGNRTCRRRERSADSSSRRWTIESKRRPQPAATSDTSSCDRQASRPRIYPVRFFTMSFGPKKAFSCTTHPVRTHSPRTSIFASTAHGLCSASRCSSKPGCSGCCTSKTVSRLTRSPLREWLSSSCLPRRRRSPWRTRVSIAISKIVKRAIRRLVDANIVGVLIWNLDGRHP